MTLGHVIKLTINYFNKKWIVNFWDEPMQYGDTAVECKLSFKNMMYFEPLYTNQIKFNQTTVSLP